MRVSLNLLRALAAAFLVLSAWLAALPGAQAQEYPVKPIRVINAYAAGGPNDLTLRPIAQRLGEVFGQQVIVENRAGANGNIGAEFAVRSAPDGYTLLFASTSQLTINPVLYTMPFDPMRDLAPVGAATMNPSVIVINPSVPAGSMKELIAYAKANPAKLTYASAGNGSVNHLAGELFAMLTKSKMLHVPFKGSGPALNEVVAGRVDIFIVTPATTLPFVKAGKLKMLMVSAPRRLSFAPDVPTMIEAGLPGFISQSGTGFLAPAKSPGTAINKFNAALVKYLNSPDAIAKMGALGLQLVPGTPDEYAQMLREERARWANVVKLANIKIE